MIGADHSNQFVYRFHKYDTVQWAHIVNRKFTESLYLIGTYCKPYSQWSVFVGDYCSIG